MCEVLLRPLQDADVCAAAALEKECLQTAWSERQLRTLPQEAQYWVALADGVLCGIGCIYCVAGEGEVQNLAVLPAYRRAGIGEKLLCKLLEQACGQGCNCTAVFLEVAQHNAPAQALYSKHGFVPVGVRRGFYRGEDAIVMKYSPADADRGRTEG